MSVIGHRGEVLRLPNTAPTSSANQIDKPQVAPILTAGGSNSFAVSRICLWG